MTGPSSYNSLINETNSDGLICTQSTLVLHKCYFWCSEWQLDILAQVQNWNNNVGKSSCATSANSTSLYCSFIVPWVEKIKKKTFPGSKLQHSLVSPVVTRCWGEVYISILSFNYHILRMEGIACQLSWQKKIKHEPMGILHNGEAEIEIVFFLLELKFLYTYKVPNSVLNKLSTSPLPI